MKISYNWLKDYIPTELDAVEAARILTDIGLEVEGLEKTETVRGGLEGVVVGEVLTCEKHPDADKLKVTTVDYGQGPVQIVCGAPNVAAGQKVAVATCGCTLYPAGAEEGVKIKKSRIRGVESNGMLCAEDELGLGTDHAGILVLDAAAKPGTPARDYFRIEDDYRLEIGLTPNRIDAASHYGVARDLAAYLRSVGKPVRLQRPSVEGFRPDHTERTVTVTVEEGEGAPRYMGVTVSGVTVKPSPDWLQNKLRSIGLNPHNNIVDVTNYILHAFGQPMHAFDADRIEGGRIVVRTVPEGTPFVTLDGVERRLSDRDLMICSAERPMCIAGVFGGLDAGVNEGTKNVFLESAYFNPVWVRKTAKRHGLSTDSSFRFERGTDPELPPYALKLAALLIKEVAGGSISSEIVDVRNADIAPFPVELSYARLNRLVGKEIPAERVKAILEGLDIRIAGETAEGLSLEVPPYRVDVRREADVAEEILRIYGYNNIEIPGHVRSTLSYAPDPDRDRIVNTASDFLSARGFSEAMSNSLTKGGYYEGLKSHPAEQSVRILNPLSSDLNVMRQTLLFGLLEAAQLNANRRNPDLKLYEFGNCYRYEASRREQGALAPYREEYRLGLLVTGLEAKGSWNRQAAPGGFFTLKAAVEDLLRRFGLNMDEGTFETLDSDLYREAVAYAIRGRRLLEMGAVSRSLRERFDLKGDAWFAEIDFHAFIKLIRNYRVTARELSRFPEVRRDLALLVDRDVTFSRLRDIAVKTEKKLLKRISLFDVYEGDKLPEGKKSYALSFILEDPVQTLTDKAIDRVMDSLVRQFEQQAGAQVRS